MKALLTIVTTIVLTCSSVLSFAQDAAETKTRMQGDFIVIEVPAGHYVVASTQSRTLDKTRSTCRPDAFVMLYVTKSKFSQSGNTFTALEHGSVSFTYRGDGLYNNDDGISQFANISRKGTITFTIKKDPNVVCKSTSVPATSAPVATSDS